MRVLADVAVVLRCFFSFFFFLPLCFLCSFPPVCFRDLFFFFYLISAHVRTSYLWNYWTKFLCAKVGRASFFEPPFDQISCHEMMHAPCKISRVLAKLGGAPFARWRAESILFQWLQANSSKSKQIMVLKSIGALRPRDSRVIPCQWCQRHASSKCCQVLGFLFAP